VVGDPNETGDWRGELDTDRRDGCRTGTALLGTDRRNGCSKNSSNSMRSLALRRRSRVKKFVNSGDVPLGILRTYSVLANELIDKNRGALEGTGVVRESGVSTQ
jgi:hypothetical protein